MSFEPPGQRIDGYDSIAGKANPIGEGGRDAPSPFGVHGDRGASPEGQCRSEPATPYGANERLFLNATRIGENRKRNTDNQDTAVCPRRTRQVRDDLAPAETPRGPRGIRTGIVYDLGRLYRLCRRVWVPYNRDIIVWITS